MAVVYVATLCCPASCKNRTLILQLSNFVQAKAAIAGSDNPSPPRIVATAYSPSDTAGPQPSMPAIIAVEAKGTGDGCYRALPSGLFALTVHLDRDMLLRAVGSSASKCRNTDPYRLNLLIFAHHAWRQIVRWRR